MATTTKKKTSKKTASTKKRTDGVVKEPPASSLADYISHWNKHGEKKSGKARESEIDIVLETAKDDLTEAEMAELESTIAPERIEKRNKSGQRAKKGEGLTRAEWRAQKFQEAAAEGIWYPGYPDGCSACGQTDRKHYSGGMCTRCYTEKRNARLIKEGKMVDPAKKRAEREAAKAAKAKAAAEARKLKEKEKLEAKREAAKAKKEAAKKTEKKS